MTVILWPNCLNILLFGTAEGRLVRAAVIGKIDKTSKTTVLPRFRKKNAAAPPGWPGGHACLKFIVTALLVLVSLGALLRQLRVQIE